MDYNESILLQLTADLGSVRVGVVSEGFQSCEPEVEAAVRAAAKSLEEAGATVSEVSIPMHLNGGRYTCSFVMFSPGNASTHPSTYTRETLVYRDSYDTEYTSNEKSFVLRPILLGGQLSMF